MSTIVYLHLYCNIKNIYITFVNTEKSNQCDRLVFYYIAKMASQSLLFSLTSSKGTSKACKSLQPDTHLRTSRKSAKAHSFI